MLRVVCYLAFVVLAFIMPSCQDQIIQDQQTYKSQELSFTQIEDARTTFSIVLAKALNNESVRSLLKNEALREFNNDSDILYQIVKNRSVSSSETLHQYLGRLHGSQADFERLTEHLPLLTILVPHIGIFDAELWDTSTTIPVVAILPTKANVDETLAVYNAQGVKSTLSRKQFPNVPALVVKDNERLAIKGSKNGRTVENAKQAYSNTLFTYLFLDMAYDGSQKVPRAANKKTRIGLFESFDPKVRFAYENNLASPRDYVYYNIAPELGLNSGRFQSTHAEYLTAIKPVSVNWSPNIWDDPVSDWTDGNFEFIFLVTAVDNKSNISTQLPRTASVPFSGLYTYNVQGGQLVPTGVREWTFLENGGRGIDLGGFSWDILRYGDAFRISIIEQDASGSSSFSQTQTTSVNSNFSLNFKIGDDKLGIGFGIGGSSTSSFGATSSITINSTDDRIGDILVRWEDPLITSRYLDFFCWLDGPWGIDFHCDAYDKAQSKTLPTGGTFDLTVEPRYK